MLACSPLPPSRCVCVRVVPLHRLFVSFFCDATSFIVGCDGGRTANTTSLTCASYQLKRYLNNNGISYKNIFKKQILFYPQYLHLISMALSVSMNFVRLINEMNENSLYSNANTWHYCHRAVFAQPSPLPPFSLPFNFTVDNRWRGHGFKHTFSHSAVNYQKNICLLTTGSIKNI